MVNTVFFVLLAFISGALPFSVWIGQYGIRKDIRHYGDGNPGMFNVLRAGGVAWGGLALILDISKAALPVGLATYVFKFDGLSLVLIAIAPVLGHAFSPFLNFKGGKAIATTGGIWIGLTLWPVPLVGIAALIIWSFTLTSSGWAVMFTLISMLIYLLLSAASGLLIVIWLLNALVLAYKHRSEITHLPVFRVPSPLRALWDVKE
ncbi:MAG: glycerol-3-phosphate acyltransferase [Chitinophagaceae bacterium]|nr:glycerol-3-phosphate acyltransferase [Anaerolineae bacterium]